MQHVSAAGALDRFSDRSLLVRAVVALAVLALALVGCGTVMPGAVVGGAGVDGAGVDATATGVGPGVTDKSVKVVFVGTDLEGVKAVTGFKTADAGDPKAQVAALEKWVNAHGGIGGRKLDAVFKLYDATDDSPAAEEQFCNQITQDDRAFAVVLTGQLQSNARPCYAKRETLILDATLVATDRQAYQEMAPYLWSPAYPEYDGTVRALINTLDDEGFFKDRDKVGVVADDTPINRRVVEGLATSMLKDLGVTPEIGWVDTTDLGSLFQGNEQAAVTFRTAGLDRVMFLGGARLASIFATVAKTQEFTATYAVSSFDSPGFFVNNPDTVPPESLKGMVGISFNPAGDVADAQLPFPRSGPEKQCLKIYQDAGITFSSRESARVALPYCDAARLLRAGAADLTDNVNASAWGAAVQEIGDSFVPATGFAGGLTPESYSGSGAYRVMAFDDECACFKYEGDDVAFPQD